MQRKTLALAVTMALAATSFSATAQDSRDAEIAALKQQLMDLAAKVQELEERSDAQSDVNVDTATQLDTLANNSTKVDTKGGIKVTSADKNFEASLGGRIHFDGNDIQGASPQHINRLGLARSFQITNLFPKLSVYENLRIAVMRRHGVQHTLWRFISGYAKVREETEQLMELVRLSGRRDAIAGELSYSEQRSMEIGMALASDPKVILLDEPMAGMSHEETDYAVELIKTVTRGRSLLIVEHDMDVVFSLCDRISVLVYGQVIATGTPEEIRNNQKVKEAYLGEEAAA